MSRNGEELDFSKDHLRSSTQNEITIGLNCKLCGKIIITEDHISCCSCRSSFHEVCIPNFLRSTEGQWKCSSCNEAEAMKEAASLEKCFQCQLSCSKEEKIDCLKCKRLFHKSCAGIDINSSVESWICQKCQESGLKLKLNVANGSIKSKNSKRSSNSRRSRISESLQILDEEKQLAEEIARKKADMLRQEEELLMKKKALILEEEEQRKGILQKKRQLLEAASAASTSSGKSTVSSSVKARNTENWVKQVPVTNGSKINKINLDPNAVSFKPQVHEPRPMHTLNPVRNMPVLSAKQTERECYPASSFQDRHLTKSNIQARHATKDLPSFAGSSEEWPLFISAFENTSRECNYSHFENQMRLLTCLKGEAKARVGSMLAYPDNVPTVIERLRKMYGQPYQIIDALTRKVRNVPRVRLDKLQSLIDLQTAVMQLCSNIYAAKIDEHLMNPSLVMEIAEKLPPELKLQWGEQLEQFGHANLEALNNWLCFKADSACRVMSFHKSDEYELKDQRPKKTKLCTGSFGNRRTTM